MTSQRTHVRRIGMRLAAVTAAGLVAVGAFAAPSGAQDTERDTEDRNTVPTLDGFERTTGEGAVAGEAELLAASTDYTGDGLQDLVAVRRSDQKLVVYPGMGDGDFGPPSAAGSGWGRMDVVMAGDLTSDGLPDLLGRDNKTGALYVYPGDGAGWFGARFQTGSGWNKMGVFTTLDWDLDGDVDLLAARESDGQLAVYPGTGTGGFGTPTLFGGGFNWVDLLVNPGDVDGDGWEDFMVRFSPTQEYYVFISSNVDPVIIQPWLGDPTYNRTYSQVAPVGDLDQDGLDDLVMVDGRSGELVRNSFDGTGNVQSGETVLDTGWGALRLPIAFADRAYDYDVDGAPDVVARQGSNGLTYDYPTDGLGHFETRFEWGADWNGANLLENAGDFTGDNVPDLIGRDASDGELWVYPGDAFGSAGGISPIKIGTGWNAMGAIVSGHDFNGDDKNDILATEKSTGYMYLYPGTGDGHVGTRSMAGSGWNGLSMLTSPGDLNHDGHADFVAVKNSDDCLYYFGGRGPGAFDPAVKLGCGWGPVDQIVSIGDFQGDGHADLLARRESDGTLFFYPGNGNAGFLSASAVGTGWSAMDLIA